MNTNLKRQKYFDFIEASALSACGLIFITLYIFQRTDITFLKREFAGLAFGIIAGILIFYGYSSKSTKFSLTLYVCSIMFLGIVMKSLNIPGSALIMAIGQLIIILAIPILAIFIYKDYSSRPRKNQFNFLLIKVLTIYIILKSILTPILGTLSNNFDFLFSLPIIFLLSYLIMQEDFTTYHSSMKNGIKSLLIFYVTVFCLKMILL